MNRTSTSNQQGVAIIGVLIVVALIAAAYSFLLSKQSAIFDSTKLSIQQIKLFNYFYSIQSLAKSGISQYNKEEDKFGGAYDNLYGVPYSYPIMGGYITATLSDRSAKVNINQILKIKDSYATLRADSNFGNCLFKITNNLGMERIDDYIIDYINNKDEKTPFLHISELKNVPGITSEYYQNLKLFLYAANEEFKININQASKEVVMCLHNDIDSYIADNIMSSKPIKSLPSLQKILTAQLSHLSTNDVVSQIMPMLEVTSHYFELNSEISVGDAQLKATSILIDKGGKIDSYLREFDYIL